MSDTISDERLAELIATYERFDTDVSRETRSALRELAALRAQVVDHVHTHYPCFTGRTCCGCDNAASPEEPT